MEHIIDDLLVRFTAKGRLSAEHDVEDNTHAPVITLGGVTSFKDFGSDIVRCAVWRVHYLVLANALGQTEVNELDVSVFAFFIKQEVLRLDISVIGSEVTGDILDARKLLLTYGKCD